MILHGKIFDVASATSTRSPTSFRTIESRSLWMASHHSFCSSALSFFKSLIFCGTSFTIESVSSSKTSSDAHANADNRARFHPNQSDWMLIRFVGSWRRRWATCPCISLQETWSHACCDALPSVVVAVVARCPSWPTGRPCRPAAPSVQHPSLSRDPPRQVMVARIPAHVVAPHPTGQLVPQPLIDRPAAHPSAERLGRVVVHLPLPSLVAVSLHDQHVPG
mmetsp:Transcript_14323/g.34159  ORF Transcript_14323/g.34159 Transcript_14323/m.34159 type:complete len:221 (+) Transcript_14323:1014-1676(+)